MFLGLNGEIRWKTKQFIDSTMKSHLENVPCLIVLVLLMVIVHLFLLRKRTGQNIILAIKKEYIFIVPSIQKLNLRILLTIRMDINFI